MDKCEIIKNNKQIAKSEEKVNLKGIGAKIETYKEIQPKVKKISK
jgi:hypothetical protein